MKLRFLAVLAGTTPLCSAVQLKPGEKGIHIDAGSLGGFELAYPAFSNGSKDVHPLVEARASGSTATLKYEGGVTVQVAASDAGDITFTFSGTPADVKSFSTTVLIDISFGRGGKWNAGEKEGVFPKEKATPPQFFSGNTNAVTISNAAGDQLNFKIPDDSFVQLTDNREWGWGIYAMRCFVNLNPSTKSTKFNVAVQKGSGTAVIVDNFGQSTLEDWPGKLKSEE